MSDRLAEIQDEGNADASARRTFEYDQVKTLYDYTKFHIGLYLTLGTILVAAFGAKTTVNFYEPALWLAVFCLGAAGMAGGVIASTLPHCTSLRDFMKDPIGPYDSEWFTGRCWTRIEHTAFWLGIFAAAVSVCLGLYIPDLWPHHRVTATGNCI